ncbi:MAG: hypothetical protein O7A08_13160, partial [SAR324 cluster bacterium]|nr:hypothetical protein [SAR324 cluster bacterium]
MKTSKLKTLLAAVVTGIIVLAGCSADDKAPTTGNAPVVDKDIIIMITSPIVDNLYSRVDPLLEYTVREEGVSSLVPASWVSAKVHHIVDGLQAVTIPVDDPASGSRLPGLDDGLQQLEFIVEPENEGQRKVTVILNYRTDFTAPTINTIQVIADESKTLILLDEPLILNTEDGLIEVNVFLTNDPQPVLQYVIEE